MESSQIVYEKNVSWLSTILSKNQIRLRQRGSFMSIFKNFLQIIGILLGLYKYLLQFVWIKNKLKKLFEMLWIPDAWELQFGIF